MKLIIKKLRKIRLKEGLLLLITIIILNTSCLGTHRTARNILKTGWCNCPEIRKCRNTDYTNITTRVLDDGLYNFTISEDMDSLFIIQGVGENEIYGSMWNKYDTINYIYEQYTDNLRMVDENLFSFREYLWIGRWDIDSLGNYANKNQAFPLESHNHALFITSNNTYCFRYKFFIK